MQNKGFLKFSGYALLFFTVLSFLTPFWVFKDLLFPFITSKAFYFRIMVDLGLPFFVYILFSEPKARPSIKNPLHIFVLLFLLLNFVSAIVGVDFQKAMWGNFERMGGVFYMTHLTLLYFYIVVLGKLNFSFLKTILYSNITIATVLSIYAIFVRLGMQPWVPDPSLPRISATFGNPIFFPSYIIPIMFLGIFWAFRKQGFVKYLLLFCSFLQLIGIFLSGTRGAVVGLILGGLVAIFSAIILAKKSKAKTWSLVGAVVCLALGIGLYFNSNLLPQGMVRRVFQLRDSNTEARLIQWRVAARGFLDYPVFGTGAENYYVVGNKYFNPKIYIYDPSWFDKPHNYILEVLVTSGAVGFLAYLGILLSCIWAFYKALKFGAVSLVGFSALLAGLLAYEIQNLFVFDTVSASISFFIFASFGAYLWEKILTPDNSKAKKNKQLAANFWQAGAGLSFSAFFVSLILAIYVLWAGNIMPLYASADTNYGYAYVSADPALSEKFFQSAVNNPFNFDQTETASKYQDFAVGILRSPGKMSKDFVDTVVNHSILALEGVVKQNPNNPIIWQKLSSLYLNSSYLNNGSIDPRALDAINKAVELAPKRTEAMSALFQIKMIAGDVTEGVKIGNIMSELNPKNLDIKWQLSIALKDQDLQAAIKLSEMLLDKKYQFPSTDSLKWLLEYYRKTGNKERMVQVAENIVSLDPENKDIYLFLIQVYIEAGEKEKASILAQKLMETDPSLKEKLQNILK